MCRILTGWQNNYDGKSICTYSNDGEAYTTVSFKEDDDTKKGKKKEITSF